MLAKPICLLLLTAVVVARLRCGGCPLRAGLRALPYLELLEHSYEYSYELKAVRPTPYRTVPARTTTLVGVPVHVRDGRTSTVMAGLTRTGT
eukprot:scaffold381434_cov39-Prasinocladus_malaysianus.AAC.1